MRDDHKGYRERISRISSSSFSPSSSSLFYSSYTASFRRAIFGRLRAHIGACRVNGKLSECYGV